jgi:GH15 family glucan-1,4-alpha-glucosidase
MCETVKRVRADLSDDGFVYRHLDVNDGVFGKEGAFIVASFWLIENLAKMGKTDEAVDHFNRIVGNAPGHGLMAEEIDTGSREWLGNYPQAFSHIGLINAALSITEAKTEHDNKR